MGCMGWSQGGYISAFLTTNTTMFKAISVGAGISNWITYYVNTDITPFTRQYLEATPWSDMEVYLKTSPMTNINKARTPTLIQHGEFDRRVPIPNAYELYRGLQDKGVPSKLIVYKGFGHGINKPKERLAATWHNWVWFNKYVFGENDEMLFHYIVQTLVKSLLSLIHFSHRPSLYVKIFLYSIIHFYPKTFKHEKTFYPGRIGISAYRRNPQLSKISNQNRRL
jgi:hypothetical protein